MIGSTAIKGNEKGARRSIRLRDRYAVDQPFIYVVWPERNKDFVAQRNMQKSLDTVSRRH